MSKKAPNKVTADIGKGHEVFSIPGKTRAIQFLTVLLTVLVLAEILLLQQLYIDNTLGITSFLDRLLVIGGALAAGVVLGFVALRFINYRVAIDDATLSYLKAGKVLESVSVNDISRMTLGWFRYYTLQRRPKPAIKIELSDRSFIVPAGLVSKRSGEEIAGFLKRHLSSVPLQGELPRTLRFVGHIAIVVFVFLTAALTYPLFYNSKGNELAAVYYAGNEIAVEVYNRGDLTRGFKFTSLAALSKGSAAVGTKRQGAWIFQVPDKWTKIKGVGDYVISLDADPEGRIAAAWSFSEDERWDAAEVGLIENSAVTGYNLAVGKGSAKDVLFRYPYLYLANKEGLFRINEKGKKERLIKGWCSNLKRGPKGGIYVYNRKGKWPLLMKIDRAHKVVEVTGEKETPAYYTFDNYNRLWGFWSGGQAKLNPPQGRELKRLPRRVKGCCTASGTVWVKTQEKATGQYGMGYMDPDSLKFVELVSPATAGGPSVISCAEKALWTAGERPLRF